ncbi:single-stranded DNA-binding protein [Streptantibioticus rubrisoli]|uniref:Single-stranded DNA-binding protein n=1 Tax=Streptantibioticus rubrisoli TaxID=1387313 RepID=A0ABT1PH18_9ACTN|nr:single-stranded DNA-binding protein [Streptantibioticus rubrisoli]MCQ4044645.1 single-stranded DNA-binding protein [Streptantibioticus rubrisoli]
MSAGETPLTIVGNLTDDPELRFTPSGAAMVKFTVASTPRAYDKTSGQWRDGTSMFMRCTAWRALAEHVTETLHKGTRVVVTGRLRQFDWTTDNDEKRSMLALEVDDIGPSLLFATAQVQRVNRSSAPAASGDAWQVGGASPAAQQGSDAPPF